MKQYDVAIIGAGPAGIFAAYELTKKNSALKVAVFESGKDIYSRACPIAQGKVKSCIGCKPCSIMRGFGGAGAFSRDDVPVFGHARPGGRRAVPFTPPPLSATWGRTLPASPRSVCQEKQDRQLHSLWESGFSPKDVSTNV